MNERCYHCERIEGTPYHNQGGEERTVELRPYGPQGQLICFECAMMDEETTKANFYVMLDAVRAISPVVVIGNNRGPDPVVFANEEGENRG